MAIFIRMNNGFSLDSGSLNSVASPGVKLEQI